MISARNGRSSPQSSHLTVEYVPAPPASSLLKDLLDSSLVLAEDWESLPEEARHELEHCPQRELLLTRLVEHKLLTEYQAGRIEAGSTFGLILGNYRVLERLGAGAMGVVFKAEHYRMRRVDAVKVLPMYRDQDPRLLMRFFAEVRAVARLRHPNIVSAMDAGEVVSPDPNAPVLHYFVMEYVPGQDLEAHVEANGSLPPARACELIYQLASALAEAHRHNLVHRDIKPSNILLTPEGQTKLLDFGLVSQARNNRLTQPGTTLGTLDFMAPEQIRDASSVDIRADIYGLGGTLFWCLTGRTPFEPKENVLQQLASRVSEAPPSVRTFRPEVSAELDAVVARMMAVNPDERYATPQAVMGALFPFQRIEGGGALLSATEGKTSSSRISPPGGNPSPVTEHRVLLVDDEASIRTICRFALKSEGLVCEEAANGAVALQALQEKPFDLVMLDIDMPVMTGTDLLKHLRENPPCPHLKVIMMSGRAPGDEMARMLSAGADDYLTKPLSFVQLQSRVKALLNLKDAQDRSDELNRQLVAVIAQQEQALSARDSEVVHVRNALVLGLAKLVEHRNTEPGAHLLRMQRFSRCLAEEAAKLPAFAGRIDDPFVQMLDYSVPLHDIGHVALPDHILFKPGKLDADERVIMQSHTLIGADTLKKVAQRHGPALGFLQLAIEIARHHHEHYDGTGYPDRLAGDAIPLSARIVALSDMYDALRTRRAYRPAFSHAGAVQVMTESSAGKFDPLLSQTFQRCAPQFERIFRELPDSMDF